MHEMEGNVDYFDACKTQMFSLRGSKSRVTFFNMSLHTEAVVSVQGKKKW
jgi:hypothetical protein